ncbi:probable 28S ribosomal protein S26, mitochondrial [Nephila pilipes]|uniref:Small ribosomal subunit protein mS26 n=1 Tax=Nephila pilipes TaxID=299642 RepID=A0A8X6PGJ5_NEPPI|nr:probable 28S ribosomal protein S26, mitochondrial [Nephila pilipes]
MQLRWKKIPKRKPKFLPTAASKLFRIPEHPYVPPDEKQLIDDLLEEYYRKIDSLRVLFKAELNQKNIDEGHTLENQRDEEAKFCLLLEENKKENERIAKIREETMEKIFQEKQIHLLQLEENRKITNEEIKMKVDEIVRNEKEKTAAFITYENIDEVIEKALYEPKNFNFAIDVNGNIKWEGTPPSELEEEIKQRITQSRES